MKRLRLPAVQRLRLRENQVFLGLTIVVGIIAGLSAVLFSLGIDLVTRLFFGFNPSGLRLFLVPALASIGTGLLLAKVFPDVRGSGIPQTKAAFHLRGGAIPGRVPLGKFVTGILCIGSGHSIGREGPSVQIGAGLASVIGRRLALSPARARDLVPVGAAGALAAAFNTPVAAVLFALEEIIGNLNATLIGSTVLASVAAVVVQRSILGNVPLFRVPAYHLEHPAELLAYGALGIVGGAISVLFCKGLLGLRRLFLSLPPATRTVHPAIGGVIIGVVLIFVPEVMGVGYEHVDQALNGALVLETMMLLCAVKMGATIVSYSSGNAGGIFAPSLFIGAMAGGAVGLVVRAVAPFPTADPGAYALVGMGALFAGIIRAPMTSVFMIFEITQDYHILVPLMVANLLSFMISRRYQPTAVYHALLEQDGVHLPPAFSLSRAPSALNGEAPSSSSTAAAMMSTEFTLVSADGPAGDLLDESRATGVPAFLVGRDRRLIGVVTASQLEDAVNSGEAAAPLASLVDRPIVHAHPDQSLEVVLDRLTQSGGVLPVVNRERVDEVVGVVTLDGLMRFMRARRGRGPSA